MSLPRTAARKIPIALKRRHVATIAVILALGVLPIFSSLTTTAAVAGSKNASFVGTWNITDPADPSTTATLVVDSENTVTGDFSGTLTAYGDNGPAFDAPFAVLDGRVTGTSFSFRLERDDIGLRDATYIALLSGSIDGNNASGTLHSSIDPPVDDQHNAFVGFRSIDLTRTSFDVSGTIIYGCSGGAGVCGADAAPLWNAEVDIAGPTSDSTMTDGDGKWSFSVPPGHYTITPTAPDVDFTPASIVVDVTAATPDQDFTSCVSATVSAPYVRAPLALSAAPSTTWSLARKNCFNLYNVAYFTASQSAVVSWTALKYFCPGGKKKYDASYGRQLFNYDVIKGRSSKGYVFVRPNHDVSIVANDANGVDVLDFLIHAGGATGTVTTHVSSYNVPINNAGSNYNCAPVPDTNAPLS